MYTKGATAEPELKTISPPNRKSTNKIGINQYFFLTLIKLINSIKKDIKLKLIFHTVDIIFPVNPICF